MRISDWSSDVCSSDLPGGPGPGHDRSGEAGRAQDQQAPTGRADRHGVAPVPPGRAQGGPERMGARLAHRPVPRSEEHTSELQPLMRIMYAAFCSKKKIII